MRAKAWRVTGRLALTGLFAAALLLAGIANAPAAAAPSQQDDRQIDEAAQPAPSPAAPAAARDQSPLVDAVVRLVNLERAKEGAPPLQVDDRLMRAAQEY